jgi:hypothetical protein
MVVKRRFSGFEVPVDHADVVSGREGAQDLSADEGDPLLGDGRVLSNGLGEGPAPQELHHEERGAAGRRHEVQDLHDVGVIEGSHDLGLPPESDEQIRAIAQARMQDLDRDRHVGQILARRFVHGPHATGAEHRSDAIAPREYGALGGPAMKGDGPGYARAEPRKIRRLGEVFECAGSDGSHGGRYVGSPRLENEGCIGELAADSLEERHSVHVRHPDIANDDVYGVRRKQLARCRAAARLDDMVAFSPKPLGETPAQDVVVVHQQQRAGLRPRCVLGTHGAHDATTPIRLA